MGKALWHTNLQANVKDHDLVNTNEGEEVAAIKVEHVEALVERRGGGLVST
jgi:hypothetical protein